MNTSKNFRSIQLQSPRVSERKLASQAGFLFAALLLSVLFAAGILIYLSLQPSSASSIYLTPDSQYGIDIKQPALNQVPDSRLNSPKGLSAILPAADPAQQTFVDVPREHWAYDEIEALYHVGFTSGCSTDPLMYCPDSGLTRGEMSVFVLHSVYSAAFNPPEPTYQLFADTPLSHWAANWVTRMYEDEYSAGCSTDPLLFCTDNAHTREEAAVFGLHIKYGSSYTPPPAVGLFADVDPSSWSAKWVEAAYQNNLLDPCLTEPELMFCPKVILTRDWAAVMLARALDLELEPPPTPVPSPTPQPPSPTITPGTHDPVAVITVLHDTSEQMDDFSNTTVLDTRTIRFQIDDSFDPDGAADLQNGGSFYIRVHSRRYLGCGTVWSEPILSYQSVSGRTFEVTLDEIGYYSVELTVTDSTGRENDTRFYFYTKVSPQNLGPEPAGNHAPVPAVTIQNSDGGSGTRSDPFRISDETMYFNLLNSYDADGNSDLQQGLFAFQIDADGMHPLHSGTITYDAMKQQDSTLQMSELNGEKEFSIDAYVIDRWGRVSLRTFYCIHITR